LELLNDVIKFVSNPSFAFMNIAELNTSLVALIRKKEELSKLSYNDERYDDVEEELHDMEDEFNENYGEYLEEVLEEVHERLCPDSDVLLPTAYLPNNLAALETGKPGPKEGVWVDTDEFPNKEARLVLVPNPTRLILSVGTSIQKEVWKA
jgi:hypothetical protein